MNVEGEVAAVWADIETWLRAHAPDRAAELGQGAAAGQIEGAEAAIGYALPADYAASLTIHNGEAALSDYTYLSIASCLDNWSRLNKQEERGVFADGRIDNAEAALIQPRWWHRGWLPFAKDGGGNLLCLDLDPAPNGRSGQVLRFERDMGPGPIGFSSFLAWLADYRDRLANGSYVAGDDGFIIEAAQT